MKNTTLPLAIFALLGFAGCSRPSLTQPTRNFYCKWAGIGNVIVAVEMQISEVGPNRLSGRWTARGNGTANGFGSGYFTLQPEPTAETTAPEVTLQNRLATSN